KRWTSPVWDADTIRKARTTLAVFESLRADSSVEVRVAELNPSYHYLEIRDAATGNKETIAHYLGSGEWRQKNHNRIDDRAIVEAIRRTGIRVDEIASHSLRQPALDPGLIPDDFEAAFYA